MHGRVPALRRAPALRHTESTMCSIRLSATICLSPYATPTPRNSLILPWGRGIVFEAERPQSLQCGNSPHWSDSPLPARLAPNAELPGLQASKRMDTSDWRDLA